jgi:HAD superfamily hydrolase (TIGR01509 family)
VGNEIKQQRGKSKSGPAFLFDLDGTLVDSVYQHVLAWREALEKSGIELAVWRIHRRIGMSGGLLIDALLREIGRRFRKTEADRLAQLHEEGYERLRPQVRLLPGSLDLLASLTRDGVPWAIATSGRLASARPMLALLQLGPETPVITRDQVERAKPDPDLFLAAAERLGVSASESVVVGDSVWDLLAARMRSEWVSFPAVMAKMNWNVRARTAFTRIPRTSCCT